MAKIPTFIKPMLAKLIEEPFDSPQWLFEIKWDGYRALAFIDKKVQLYSRNEKSFNHIFSPIVEDLSHLKVKAVLDGEIVVLDKKGKSEFQLMQNYQTTQQGNLYYYVFDLLFLNGKDLRSFPLIDRKQLLEQLLTSNTLEYVRYSDHILKKGKSFFKKACKKGLEGIMAKNIESEYVSQRTRDWLKIKTHQRQEVVIGGYTEPRGSRKKFGALLIGVYNDKQQLVYVGHVGGGFNFKTLTDVFKKMQPLAQKKCPFINAPKTNMPATWIKPKLVCEVSFAEWTKGGNLRQPIFHGLRIDKKAKDVRREKYV